MKIKIGVVDDHNLFVDSLQKLLEVFSDFEVIIKATSGKKLQYLLQNINTVPDIFLVDVGMEEMSGYEIANWLRITYPLMKIVALSQDCSPISIRRMLQAGCCCYLLKSIESDKFELALKEIYTKGFYIGGAEFGED